MITIVLTGATGFLGTQLALHLIRESDARIFALLRAGDSAAAVQRLLREWWDWPELRAAVGTRVVAMPADITQPRLGLTAENYARLAQEATHILHAAADVRLFAPLDSLRKTNVVGTRHTLELARAVQANHGLQRFAHVSTAYVAGDRSGPVREDDLRDDFGFSCPYEQSKYEAEQLVRQAAADLPVSIFRPGMIVGDSNSGATKTFNTLYYPLRLYMTGQLRLAPARPDLRINFSPVDYVAGAIARLALDERAIGLTFHLSAPHHATPTLAELARFSQAWAANPDNPHLPHPLKLAAASFLPLPGLEKLAANPLGGALLKKLAGQDLSPLLGLLAYFRKQPVFLRDNTDRLLGPYPHHWQEILPPLLAFATRHSFWHPSTRTVHEQILFRLNSRRKPIVFHDLCAGPDGALHQSTRPPAELHQEILAAAAALRALAIQPGERIAILGPNSTRYLASTVASGLAGTVCVPIYPTTPLREVEVLLKDSQARLFLVGAPEVLQRIDEIQFDGPVVSFCLEGNHPCNKNQAPSAPLAERARSPKHLSWADFLAQGRSQPFEPQPVPLDAPAVMFYTSGTTGRPKGVIYRHEQLRWLAETLAAMYPWRERNTWGSYLSYLPMSHVVEGILAGFSPYYVPAALDIYFLEDFQALPQALKTAQPTIFFSVPRFFEKVRAAFMQNRLAQFYMKLPQQHPLRRPLRWLLRRGLLRKAGLKGCRQMLVGSAPTPPELLGFFQALGIEVHNAYGLTEAPLVSLNRLSRNRVDTVGELLPDTRVRMAADGEVEVSGPQVACGYYDQGQVQAFQGGWFATGDLGHMTPDGFLSIHGRKKDIIITAYGENIYTMPIEARLRSIPGIAEALLVGDGRPYCAALFWMEESAWNLEAIPALEEEVCAINDSLPKPAQIKRWVVMRGSLTVANGYLTGSMKVKRALVTERMASIIDALYRGDTIPEILYRGGIQKN